MKNISVIISKDDLFQGNLGVPRFRACAGSGVLPCQMVLPDYEVRYIAINDNVDTLRSENEMMVFKNVFNDWYARDCSKKLIRFREWYTVLTAARKCISAVPKGSIQTKNT